MPGKCYAFLLSGIKNRHIQPERYAPFEPKFFKNYRKILDKNKQNDMIDILVGGFMKKIYLFIIILMGFSFYCYSQENEGVNIRNLFPFNYNRLQNLNQEQLSIINYILKNTYENNIHRMRGETENRVYTNEDGREAVFDKNGNLVTNSYNRGSYNYASYNRPIDKFILDIAPWLEWGNTRDDPTSFEERLYYYTLDLNYGIQKYVFEGYRENLEEILFNELSENEKEVYYIFIHIIFNEGYKIQLDRENIPRLINDGKYYYEYFYQIQELLNVKQ
jgi:hypothetical protein